MTQAGRTGLAIGGGALEALLAAAFDSAAKRAEWESCASAAEDPLGSGGGAAAPWGNGGTAGAGADAGSDSAADIIAAALGGCGLPGEEDTGGQPACSPTVIPPAAAEVPSWRRLTALAQADRYLYRPSLLRAFAESFRCAAGHALDESLILCSCRLCCELMSNSSPLSCSPASLSQRARRGPPAARRASVRRSRGEYAKAWPAGKARCRRS